MEGASLRYLPRSYTQLPIQKVTGTIGRSQLQFLLESEEYLERVTATSPLDSIDSLSTEFEESHPDDPIMINSIIVQRPACELLKMS
jgi:hypothetical protein